MIKRELHNLRTTAYRGTQLEFRLGEVSATSRHRQFVAIEPSDHWLSNDFTCEISNFRSAPNLTTKCAPIGFFAGGTLETKMNWRPEEKDDFIIIAIDCSAIDDVIAPHSLNPVVCILSFDLRVLSHAPHVPIKTPVQTLQARLVISPYRLENVALSLANPAGEEAENELVTAFPDLSEMQGLARLGYLNLNVYGTRRFCEPLHGRLAAELQLADQLIPVLICGAKDADPGQPIFDIPVTPDMDGREFKASLWALFSRSQDAAQAIAEPGMAHALTGMLKATLQLAPDRILAQGNWNTTITPSISPGRLCLDAWNGKITADTAPSLSHHLPLDGFHPQELAMPHASMVRAACDGAETFMTALGLRVWLAGNIAQDNSVPLSVTATMLAVGGARSPSLNLDWSGLLRLETDLATRKNIDQRILRLVIDRQAHSVDIGIGIPVSLLDYPLPEEEFPLSLRIRVEIAMFDGTASDSRVCLVHDVHVNAQLHNRSYTAIDLGVSSIAIAMSDEINFPETLQLGATLSRYDPGHDEASESNLFIASYVGLGEKRAWRARAAPSSLVGYFPEGPVLPSAQKVAARLGRSYFVSLPFAPAGDLAPSEAVIFSPKMQMTQGGGRMRLNTDIRYLDEQGRPVDGRDIDTAKLIGDALHELVDLYVMWDPHAEKCLNSRIVLTHPNRYSTSHRKTLRRIAKAMCERLGGNSGAHSLYLVSESDAVAYYFMHKIPAQLKRQAPEAFEKIQDNGRIRILAFDLGAGTLDLSLVEAEYSVNHGLGPPHVHRRIGAAVGGDSIDLVLYFLVHEVLSRLKPEHGMTYARSLVDPGDDSKEDTFIIARRNLSQAIRRAKADLTKKCLKVSEKAYVWPNTISLRIKVGHVGARESGEWPLSGEEITTKPVVLAEGIQLIVVRDETRFGEVFLELDKAVVNTKSMRDLMRFMSDTLVRKCLNREQLPLNNDESEFLLITGRASLWPLLYESLHNQVANLNIQFVYSRPCDADELKRAVCVGAIMRARSPEGNERTESGEIGLMSCIPNFKQIEMWQPLKPGKIERLHLAHTLFLAEVAPDTSTALLKKPWHENMVLPLGEIGSARDICSIDKPVNVSVRMNDDGIPVLLVDGLEYNPTPKGLPRALTVQELNFRIKNMDAPPSWEETVNELHRTFGLAALDT